MKVGHSKKRKPKLMNKDRAAAFDAVVFDLDGIFVDSERIYFEAWCAAAVTLGCSDVLPVFEGIIGLPFDDAKHLVEDVLHADTTIDEFLDVVSTELQPLLADGYPLKAGVFEILDFLQEHDVPCAVATSSTGTVPVKLQNNGIDHYFRHIVRRDQVARGKPHPDLYIEAARRLDLPPERCLAVEDSEPGLRAALAAGLTAVHIPDIGKIDAEILAGCSAVCDDLHDFRRWLTLPPDHGTVGQTREDGPR